MTNCLLINVNGEISNINKESIELVKKDNVNILESIEVIDNNSNEKYFIIIIGTTSLKYPFNKYNFQYTNPTGDVYVTLTDNNFSIMDISIEDFKDIYEEEEDLDNNILQDELIDDDDDDDSLDGFIVKD